MESKKNIKVEREHNFTEVKMKTKKFVSNETRQKLSMIQFSVLNNLEDINCKNCNNLIHRRSTNHKYCEECYLKKERTRMLIRAKADRIKHNARQLAQQIEMADHCEICKDRDIPLQRHHWRYDKPLLINTLCRTCHEIQHVNDFYSSEFAQEVAN